MATQGGQDFSTEELLKRRALNLTPGGRGIEYSGVTMPKIPWNTDPNRSKYDLQGGTKTYPKSGGFRDTAPLPKGGTISRTVDSKGNETWSTTTPDGKKTTIRSGNPTAIDEMGHGNFTADIKNPNGSSEHVRQWVSGLSASDHGEHTRRDAKGNLTSRFQVDNIKYNYSSPLNYYTENRVHGYHAPTPASSDLVGGSPAASGRWSVSAERQARTAAAQPKPTGGEVGGKEGHAFHGNQFTAHGTDVPVKNPQAATKKSLTGSDFAIENLVGW